MKLWSLKGVVLSFFIGLTLVINSSNIVLADGKGSQSSKKNMPDQTDYKDLDGGGSSNGQDPDLQGVSLEGYANGDSGSGFSDWGDCSDLLN